MPPYQNRYENLGNKRGLQDKIHRVRNGLEPYDKRHKKEEVRNIEHNDN